MRIDDFCILSGQIKLGSHIHIAAGTYLFAGSAGIEIEDFSGLSSKCCIYAESDDYSGVTLTNPTILKKYKKVTSKKVTVGRHVIIGSGACVLPGVTLNEGASLGAGSLLTKSAESWSIYFGSPAKKIRRRKQDLLKLEPEFLKEWQEEANNYDPEV